MWSKRMMKQKIRLATFVMVGAIALAGCASDVIIFYPKASATKAADNVIDDIFGAPAAPITAVAPVVPPTVEVLKK
jgi:ABC-type glycerol-3-phosphate transport system substrate-binding protein